jgi:glycosyltransferase involved in cell wall biosynthesis
MKLAYLARRPIPSVHAHAVQIVKMCEAFGKQGHEVGLFAVRGDDEPASTFSRYEVSGVFDILTHPRRLKHLKKPRFLAWLMRQPSLRHADAYFGRDIASLSAAARFGKPVIYEAHAIPRINSVRWRLLSRLFARENFSHLVCVTSTLAELHRQQFPALAHKPILVVPNGAADIPAGPALGHWPGREGATQVGFVGRPFPGKGIETMVAAARDCPELDFHIVGADRGDLTWIDGKLPQNLHFHGYQPHGRLGTYFSRFDMAVAPYGAKVMNSSGVESASITCPLKLLEYMAAGLPTVVSALPGLSDIVKEDGEGVTILVPPGDQAAFSQAVMRLAGDAELRRKMGTAARARYLERHTIEARARTVLASLA